MEYIFDKFKLFIWFVNFYLVSQNIRFLMITLYNVILRISRNLLETRENIKIESHPFYHIICDWFSWGSSKKKIASSLWKSAKATWLSRMGRNFDDYPGLQQKSKCA
jgi:hypothetical protein